jgi:hypothetical protein
VDVGSFYTCLFGDVYATCGDFHDGSEKGNVLTHQFLAKNKIAVIPHPLYSPDLAPCDFFLFPKLKLKLKGRQFDAIEEIQAESRRVLDPDRKGLPGSIPKIFMCCVKPDDGRCWPKHVVS